MDEEIISEEHLEWFASLVGLTVEEFVSLDEDTFSEAVSIIQEGIFDSIKKALGGKPSPAQARAQMRSHRPVRKGPPSREPIDLPKVSGRMSISHGGAAARSGEEKIRRTGRLHVAVHGEAPGKTARQMRRDEPTQVVRMRKRG